MIDELKEERFKLIAANIEIQRRISAEPKKSVKRRGLAAIVEMNIERIKELNEQLKLDGIVSTDRHTVTDHALCRYLERVHGLNLDKIRDKILEGLEWNAFDRIRKGDVTYVFSEHKLVTVLPE